MSVTSNEYQYLNLLSDILENGEWQQNRTGVDTLGVFGRQLRFDMSKGFPLLTTKKMYTKAIIHELLWFIAGGTNAYDLIKHGVRIWDEWTPAYKAGGHEKVQASFDVGDMEALELGPVYGHEWRNFGKRKIVINDDTYYTAGVDQLTQLIERIKTNPQCRRLIISAWNPVDVPQQALPPCHAFMQFRIYGDKLNLQMYQRSADVFLGVPFNIASYALLLTMVAAVTGYKAGEFVHTFGDVHIYKNHMDQVKEQLSRQPFSAPTLSIMKIPSNIFGFEYDDFRIDGYESYAAIKAEVAV